MAPIDLSGLSQINYQYRPPLDVVNVPTSQQVIDPQSGLPVASCHMYYTVHGDSQSVYLQRSADSFVLVELLSGEVDELTPDGNRSLLTSLLPTMHDLVTFLEESDDWHTPWSYCLFDVLEDDVDDILNMDANLQRNVVFESDIYPELPVFYGKLSQALVEYVKMNGQLPEFQVWTSALQEALLVQQRP